MSVFELDKQYIAGTYNRFPVCITRGKGSLVYDENDKEYIDMGSGIGVTSFGIADDVWQKAVTDQVSRVQHMSNLYYTEPCARLAEALCGKTGLSKVFFSNSGAEANECAIKVARKYAAEKHGEDCYTVATLKNSFHGRTLTTLSATGQEHYHELFRPLTPGFISIDASEGIAALENASKSVKIAAVMIECIQGEGGVVVMDKQFVQAVRSFCSEHDILMIVDEVQTGNGRTGEFYAYMNCGIVPDVVSTAKGLAGGLPLGATLIGEKGQNALGFGDHGSTFGGNPVCCAAALSIVSRIDAQLLADVKRKGKLLENAFLGAGGIEGVSGLGLMMGIKTTAPAAQVLRRCMEKGVLCLTAKDKVRLLPALNIPDEVLLRATQIIKDAAAELV